MMKQHIREYEIKMTRTELVAMIRASQMYESLYKRMDLKPRQCIHDVSVLARLSEKIEGILL